MKTIDLICYDENDNEYVMALPTRREVCERCNGYGAHTNPAIDGNGISAQEFNRDPEFAEEYFSGMYDIQCEECHGERVVDVVDRERLTEAQRAELESQEAEQRAAYYEARAERLMGC